MLKKIVTTFVLVSFLGCATQQARILPPVPGSPEYKALTLKQNESPQAVSDNNRFDNNDSEYSTESVQVQENKRKIGKVLLGILGFAANIALGISFNQAVGISPDWDDVGIH